MEKNTSTQRRASSSYGNERRYDAYARPASADRAPARPATRPSAARGTAPRTNQAVSYMPRSDRETLGSKLNSLRLRYLRRVPAHTRRLIALGVLLLLVALIALIVALCLRGRGAHPDRAVNTVAMPYLDVNAGQTEAQTETTTYTADALADGSGGDNSAETETADQAVWADETTQTAETTQTVETVDTQQAAESWESLDAEPTAAADFMPDTSGSAQAAVAAGGATTWNTAAYVPETQGEGYLPVFMKANRTDKVIAITVDDGYQTENLKEIIQAAEAVNAKLTIFPIGELLVRESLQEVLRYAHSIGFEIENHTWHHAGLYHNTNEELASEIFDQDRGIDLILNLNYSTHFLRPRGGDDRNDIRTHAYIKQLGYYGIAHWSVCGTGSNIEALKKSLAPGETYLFHCIDSDAAMLKEFIPYAVSQGYQLITFNEMFGYAKNAEEALSDDPRARTIPQLLAYERDYSKTMKKPTYSYMAYEVQKRLIDLGFSSGEPDGIYGPGTETAAKAWQKSIGVPEDGVLTTELLHRLLDDVPTVGAASATGGTGTSGVATPASAPQVDTTGTAGSTGTDAAVFDEAEPAGDTSGTI